MMIRARRQKTMNLIQGNLKSCPRPLFYKISIDLLHLNHLGAFCKRHILGFRHPKLASLGMECRTGLSIANLAQVMSQAQVTLLCMKCCMQQVCNKCQFMYKRKHLGSRLRLGSIGKRLETETIQEAITLNLTPEIFVLSGFTA